ncbi:glycosyltransferase family 4 protein [Polluticaenibacter yanchengensis]|uniref:Glycosyltransferase family 4 protein n=1 Tax=Polluticaenibacter yanchengensis TaxID=3014562 RepID=A0ABT4UKZ2_9BACT|nr:glycosyltransferase family 4 protein [Chitinophagaceae bacterium LY-5]
MDILYFYQYFGTDKGGWSTRVYEMCKRWVAEGHNVTVVTTPYDKSDIPKFKGISKEFEYSGIKVIVLNFPQTNKVSVFKRIVGFVKYMLLAMVYIFRLKFDVAIASSGPITVGVLGIFAKIFRRKKFVFEVRDLWPSGSVQLGMLKNKVAVKFCYWLEKTCYNYADLIVACSEGMKNDIHRRYGFKHIIVIPNASDVNLFSVKSEKSLPEEYQNKKIIIYTGSLGRIDECMQILEAAKKISPEQYPDVLFLIIGAGADKERMVNFIKQENLVNVKMLDLMPKKDLVVYLQNAYISLLTIKDIPILHTCSPNKIFDAFAASVPIVQTTYGWIDQLVNETKSGLTATINNADDLSQKILYYVNNEEIRNEHAKNAYQLALNVFNRDVCAKNMIEGIKGLFDKKDSKNIWIINQFAGNDKSGWGERHYFMSKYWKENGYNVTIVSGSFNHMFFNSVEVNSIFSYEDYNGTNFCWVKTPKYNPKSVRRFWSQIVFAYRVRKLNPKKLSSPDYIVVSSLPIFPILSGAYLKRKFKAKKLIFEIRDIWPLTLIEVGNISKYNPFAYTMGLIEKYGYKKSDHIVTLLPFAHKHIVSKGGTMEKIAYIPNGLEKGIVDIQNLSDEIQSLIPKNKFIIGYAGTHNKANALEFLIQAAIKLRDDERFFFVLVGDGYLKDNLIDMAQGLNNILFLNKIHKNQVYSLLNLFDIGYVGRNATKVYDYGVSGNKYFDYMLAKIPVLDSSNVKISPVDQAMNGIKVEAENSDAIVKAIIDFYNIPIEEKHLMIERGYQFLNDNHSTKILANKYMDIFKAS